MASDVHTQNESALLNRGTEAAAVDGADCLHQRFELQVARTPGATALVFDGESLTYGELNQRANRLAHRLEAEGVAPDQLVGLHVERGIDMVVGIIGILKAGAAYLPLDPVYPPERIAFMLDDSNVQVVVTQEPLLGNLDAAPGARVLFSELENEPDHNPAATVAADNLAYVIYTSGSTGKPKGALITHRNVTRLFDSTDAWFGFNEQDVWTLFHSYAFDFSVWELWGAVLYGGRVIVIPYRVSRSPDDFRALIVREGVTVLNQTPSAFRQLIQAELAQPETELALRYVIFGGEALELQSLKPWFDRFGDDRPRLINMYGITETTVHVTYRPIGLNDLESGQGSVIGVPIPDLQLHILDEAGAPVQPGTAGEMYVGGAGVARGYLERPELTAERFITDPFSDEKGARLYRTGDLARRLGNGDIEYLGRTDFQVKIRGFRIELGEIETAIASHGAVREAAVIAREDTPGDKQLVAYVVAPGASDDIAGELKESLRARLPEYMVPAHFVSLDTLPLTENGKLDRKALPAPVRVSSAATYVAPRNTTEEALASIWSEVLGYEQVGIEDDFFELGGNSLLVITVLQKMRSAGLHADVSTLFLAPTIARIAAVVGSDSLDVDVPPNLIPKDCDRITPDMLPLVSLNADEIQAVVAAIPGGAANIQDIYPLSPLQEGMLFHHRMAGEGDPYLVTTVLGAGDRESLVRYAEALQTVIDRHDILRTAFLWEGLSEPVQAVCRKATLVLEELELDPADGDIAAQLEARYHASHYRLDVRQVPIIRLFVAHDPANARWVLLRIHHHLMEDHTTDELMSEEIHLILNGRAADLAPPLPFRNFVAQARLGVPAEAHREFFSDMLAEVDEPTAPFGFSDVLGNTSRIDQARHLVDTTLARRLRDAALNNKVSAASLFHLAWARVLARCSGRNDVVFGTVLFGRMQAGQDAEQVLGPFINTLPLRLELGDGSVRDCVRQTHTRMAELLGHEHASLALAQSCSGVAASVPLFSALINFRHLKIQGEIPEHSNHAMAAAINKMGLDLVKFEERTNYPLELSVDDLGDAFMLEAQAQTPIDPSRICGYVSTALEQLVTALETSPDAPLDSLSVLPASEREQILVQWNDTARNYEEEPSLHGLIEQQAAKTPDAIALEFEGEELTYAEVNRRANQLARVLRDKGVEPDMLVGVMAERSFEMVLALLAVVKAGGAYVPLDPSYPAERLANVLEDAKAQLVLVQPHLAAQLPQSDAEVLEIDSDWQAFADQAGDDLDDVGTPDNLAYVIFTSGSTGRPKGAMNAHRGISNRLLWMQEQYGLTAHDRVLQKTPFSFDVSVWEFFWPLRVGARLIIARPEGHRDNAYLADVIRSRSITTMHFVPSMLRVFLEHDGGKACTSLRRVVCSGEALHYELQERFFARLPDAELHNLYGPTEAAVDVTWWACKHGDDRLTVPIGRPVANTQMYALDPQMQPVPVGVAGELYIGGVQVGRGYVGRDDLTAERFVPDPYSEAPGARLYKTGDLGRYLEDGTIEYLGRTDFQVKIRGQRIELGEIEATLDRHADVAQSVVMMREDTAGDQRLVAYVVPKGSDVSQAALKDHLSAQLPVYMVPSAFVMLDELPLTSSGKVDRKRLPAPDYSDVQSAEYVAPRNANEEMMAEIWADVLKLERVGINDNFFELGGHSLIAVTVIERMRRAGLHADIRDLFAKPSVAGLAEATGDDDTVVEAPPNRIPADCSSITPDMLTMVELSPDEIARIEARVPGGASNIQDIYPLAPLQEGFLFHHFLTTEGDLYIMETQFAFDTRAHVDRYLEALQKVVDRNDIMRSAFIWEGLREPVQVVCREAELGVEEVELDPADGDIAEQLAAKYNLLNHRIDISAPPMIRIFIARDETNDRWVFHQLTHHLMDDQATVNMQEEQILAMLEGRENELPAPRAFRDYVAQARFGVPAAEHEAFFREMLGDVAEPTAPYGLNDVMGDGSRIDEARAFCDADVARRLFRAGQRIGVSTASLFHLAWGQMLARLSGREDVVFGTCLLGRMHGGSGADQVLGPCINTLPMRLAIDGTSAIDSVRQTHAVLAQVLRHEHALLGIAQRCSKVDSATPLFNAILNYRRPTQGVGRSHGVDDSTVNADNGNESGEKLITEWFSERIEGRRFIRFLERTNYPITLSVDDFGEGFRLVSQVQAPIDPQLICDYMLTALARLVDALESEPAAPIRSLDIVPRAEQDRLVRDWNETVVDLPANGLMHASFEEQAARNSQRAAVISGTDRLTYGELNARANRIAHTLRALGVSRGERVGLCVERGTDMLAAVLGVLKAGAAYVPLDPSFPTERLQFMAEDAELGTLISTSALASTFNLDRERQLLLDEDATSIASSPDAPLAPDRALDANPGDPAYMIYTSGSTGKPKGVVVPHRAVVNFLTSMAQEPGLVPDDVLIAVTTLSFDIAVLELQLPLFVGASVVIPTRDEVMDGQALGSLLEQHGSTVMQATPITWRLLVESGWTGRSPFKALVGGEALPRDLAEQLVSLGIELWNMYGPTETTVWSTCAQISDPASITIGKPIGNTSIYIVDHDGRLCPTGVPGELCIGGAGVTLGYWKRPELTAERFVKDDFNPAPDALFYRTGDLARWRNDGMLEHLGRLDDQVKLRGYRVELGEIEVAIAEHASVKQAAVHLWRVAADDLRLVACCMPSTGAGLAPVALRRHLRTRLPDYMIPQYFLPVDEIPLTPNGKVDRRRLPTPVADQASVGRHEAPVGEVETAIVEIWTRLIQPARAIGRHDKFFEMGGHSLLAIRALQQISDRLNVKVDFRMLLQESIAEISARYPTENADRVSTSVAAAG